MNPIRIAIMTIATVSATTFAYAVFAPLPSTVVSAPVQTTTLSSAPAASDKAPVADNTVVAANTTQTQPEIQYVDIPAPSQNVARVPQENEDRNGDNNDSE
jgi:hypothetical protein